MEKIQITDKDILLSIKYTLIGKILLILFAIFGLFVGIFFLIAENTNILLCIIGFLAFINSIWLFFDVLLFKEIQITKDRIIKVWLFGKYSIPVNEIDYAYRSFYQLNRGKIVFQSFQSKKVNFFFHNFMAIHLLGVSDYEKMLLKMKKVFTNLNIIKGDEYEWNY